MKTLGRRHSTLLTMSLLAWVAFAAQSSADIVTYDNGKVLRGLVEDIPGDPANVNITTADRKLRIPKSRITNIERESRAMSHIHIGRELRAKKQLAQAIVEFQRALDAEPGNADAIAEINQTQAAMSEVQNVLREDAVRQIEDLIVQARGEMEKRQFEQAEKTLRSAADLVPTEEQKPRLQQLISDMYFAWAEDRLDKLDKIGAEEKLNLALEANPKNTAVIDRLLTLWKDNPDRQQDTAAVYETVLDHQKDNATLRKELADLYFKMGRHDDAARHYIELYTQGEDQYRGTTTEQNLIASLRQLHMKEAREKNYDLAIYHYKILSRLDPESDPGAVIYYEFLKMSAAVPQNDAAGQLGLAQFAEQNQLDEEAVDFYRKLSKVDTTRDQALAGLERYAQKSLAMAVEQGRLGNYQLAQAIAQQLLTDFPESVVAGEEAKKIIGQADVELKRANAQRGDTAKMLVQRGDEYYDQARYFYQSLYSTERRSSPGLGSIRNEAKHYYQLAVHSYTEAVRIDPTLAQDSQAVVMVRIADCRDKIRRLTSRAPRSFGQTGPTTSR